LEVGERPVRGDRLAGSDEALRTVRLIGALEGADLEYLDDGMLIIAHGFRLLSVSMVWPIRVSTLARSA
jgi:hypothetical protein